MNLILYLYSSKANKMMISEQEWNQEILLIITYMELGDKGSLPLIVHSIVTRHADPFVDRKHIRVSHTLVKQD